MSQGLRLNSCYEYRVVPSEGIILLGERNQAALLGTVYELVLPLVDGQRTPGQIAVALQGRASPADVFYCLTRLLTEGFVTGDILPAEAERGFWTGLDIESSASRERLAKTPVCLHSSDAELANMAACALSTSGVSLSEEGVLDLQFTDDYLALELGEWNKHALEQQRPWLLVQPFGSLLLIGPLFRPGVTACWECLAQRLRLNQPFETYLRQKTGKPRSPRTRAGGVSPGTQAALHLAALELAKWIVCGVNPSIDGTITSIDLLSLDIQKHRVTARPQCPVCGTSSAPSGSPASHVARGSGPPSDVDPLERYGQHVSPLTGVVSELIRLSQLPEDKENLVHNYVTGPLRAQHYPSLERLVRNLGNAAGSGKGRTDPQARDGALFEALERYSAVFQGDEPCRRASYKTLGTKAIHPGHCMLFSEHQYQNRTQLNQRDWWYQTVPDPFDEQMPLEWTRVRALASQELRYLPSAYCYLAYPSPGQGTFCRGDSNGVAAGPTLGDAVVAGFMELIERDAVAIWWYNRVRRPALDLDSFEEPYVEALRRLYRRLHRELWVLDITSDFGIPTFAAISRRIDKDPEDIVYGFGTHFEASTALLRSLLELNQMLPAVSTADSGEYNYGDECAIQWWRTAKISQQAYLAPDVQLRERSQRDYRSIGPMTVQESSARCEQLVRERGMEVLVLDLTRPDIGLPVARVVVPGLRHFWERFAPGRLYEVPVQLGWLERPRTEAELNPFPIFV